MEPNLLFLRHLAPHSCEGSNLFNVTGVQRFHCNTEWKHYDYIGDNTVQFDGEVYEILLNTTEGLPIICAMNESDHYAVITYVGSSLSMMGCVLVLLTICLFKKLRTPPMKILSNIVITNFMINLLNMLIVGDVFEQSRLCQAVAICFHFIVLAQFMWTTIMCFEILRRFYLASQLVSVISTTKKSTRRLIFYNAIAWTIPSVILIVTLDHTQLHHLRPDPLWLEW